MCCFYHTSNTINLVTATKYTAFWVIEYCVFVKDLVDCSATMHGVIFAKYVAQITKQQGRYAVGHRVQGPVSSNTEIALQVARRSTLVGGPAVGLLSVGPGDLTGPGVLTYKCGPG